MPVTFGGGMTMHIPQFMLNWHNSARVTGDAQYDKLHAPACDARILLKAIVERMTDEGSRSEARDAQHAARMLLPHVS